MISYTKAQERVLKAVEPLPTVTADFQEALGLILAEEVAADRDLPPFDRAAMDGYAVSAKDTRAAPITLPIVGELLPGDEPAFPLRPGEAVRIMTGAPLPGGADAVQMVELCEEADGKVTLLEPVEAGQHVAARGEDSGEGDVVLEPGVMITPAVIAVLAAVGKQRIAVRWRPKVGVAITGDEIVEVWQVPGPAQIRNSNGPATTARLLQVGVEVKNIGIVRDTEEEIRSALNQVSETDMIILTGGVSMGRSDLVKKVLEEENAEFLFDKVAIKPGKPTTVAMLEGCPVFALPGNPVSCQVAMELFTIPALRSMMGLAEPLPPTMRAELRAAPAPPGDRTTFHPARLVLKEGIPTAYPLPYHGSGDFVDFARAQGLVIVPKGVKGYEKSEIVDVIPLEGSGWPSV